MDPRIAFLGIGNMGRGMCKNLVEKGNLSQPLIIYNRTTKAATDLEAKLSKGKAEVVESVGDAVSKAEIIFTCLGSDAAVTSTIETALATDVKGKTFVDCSTVHPDTTKKLGKLIGDHGAAFVACPVFGATPMAEAGQLICVLAGEASAVQKVLPYCKGVMGRENIDLSDQPVEKATMLKVVGNTFIGNMVETLAEGHVLAEKSGLGVDNLHQFVETMFPGPYAVYSKRMMSGDYADPQKVLFGVDLARKDAGHAFTMAKVAGASLKALEVADDHLAMVQKCCGSGGDIAGIYGAVRQESGLPFENNKR